MIDFLAIMAILCGTLIVVSGVVMLVFRILCMDFPEERAAQQPVAWRIKHGKRYYYMDKSEPFPTQGAEPLYLGKK